MTGNDVITEALTILGVIYPGQTISTTAQTTGQTSLNNLLGEWSAQSLAVFSVQRETFSLSSGVSSYTIGSGGTFNTTRPEKIESWSVISSNGIASGGKPVDPATFVELAKDRSATGSLIQALNYDGNYPTGTIQLYPIPTGGTIELWVWQQFTAISDFTQTINFPPGYQKAICYNLAVDLAPKFGRPLDPTVKMIADQCKQGLASSNVSEHAGAPVPTPPAPPVPAQS